MSARDAREPHVSDLAAAMQAAVDSVDGRDAPRAATPTLRLVSPPPSRPATFGAVLRETLGPAGVLAWVAVRELLLLVVTFWVAAIAATYTLAEAATLPLVLGVTAVLRLLGLAATRAGRAARARRS